MQECLRKFNAEHLTQSTQVPKNGQRKH